MLVHVTAREVPPCRRSDPRGPDGLSRPVHAAPPPARAEGPASTVTATSQQ